MKNNFEKFCDIGNFINEHFEEYYEKYDFNKYSADKYTEYQESFSNFKVPNQNIEDALKWKWGHTGKSNYPNSHKVIVREVEDNWSQFVRAKYTNPKDTWAPLKTLFTIA